MVSCIHPSSLRTHVPLAPADSVSVGAMAVVRNDFWVITIPHSKFAAACSSDLLAPLLNLTVHAECDGNCRNRAWHKSLWRYIFRGRNPADTFSLVGHTITRSMELILCTGSSAMRKKISAVGRPPGQYVQPHYRGSFSPPPLIKGRGVANSLTARQAIWNQGGLVPYSAQFLLEFPLRLP